MNYKKLISKAKKLRQDTFIAFIKKGKDYLNPNLEVLVDEAIDHESKENNTVTLRNRDDQKQDRIPINDLKNIVCKYILKIHF